MNPTWKAFLEERSARFDDRGLACFHKDYTPPDCALFDLSHLGLIKVQGAEAREFMQGQFTNDTRELSPTHSQLSAHCSPKGRMLGLFRVLQQGEDFLLQLPRAQVDPILKRLRLYVLRSKVRLADRSDDLIGLGLAGVCAPGLITELMGEAPTEADAVLQQEDLCCVRLGGTVPRFALMLPPQQAMELWPRLAQEASPSNTDPWRLLAVRAGEPSIYPETVDAFVPQMTNLQWINGLSFHKGCYTGQEVVARMQYLGKLKRRMYRARISSPLPPRPGDELSSPQSSSGQGAGRIVEAAPAGPGLWEVLAVIESSLRHSPIYLGDDAGALLQFLDLPYEPAADAGEPAGP